MKLHLTPRTLFAGAAVLVSQAFTLGSFAVAERGDGAITSGAFAVLWLGLLVTRLPVATCCLTVSLGLAVLSVLAGGPGWLAVPASAASVAAWDLFRFAARGAPTEDAATERRLLRSRALELAAGLLPGLLLAGMLGLVQLSLPYPLMLGGAAVALITLYRAALPE